MYVNPLTPPTIQPVAQSTLSPWERQLDYPRPIQGLNGLSGLGAFGLGCADCGGTCCASKKPNGGGLGMGNWSENFTASLNQAAPFTSLLLHLMVLGLAVSAFKWLFLSEDSGYGARRQRITRARRDVERAGRNLKQAQSWGVL